MAVPDDTPAGPAGRTSAGGTPAEPTAPAGGGDTAASHALARTRLDAKALRVLAHPLRTRLLGALRLDGPATATALARRLGTNTGATSYHLRQLAAVGLVVETGGGTGRERWWRAVHEMHSFHLTDVAGDPDAEAATEWLKDEYFRQFTERAAAWHAVAHEWPLPWRDVAGVSDLAVTLPPDRLAALQAEVVALVERYRAEDPAAPGARRVFVYLHTYPDTAGGAP
ncbi:helix-turn-helix domain-containing protein [Georgenia sp. TF02-10]|uniref:winged helix-turn-helix domain-containing protein n=1 Tax=Georgenia sp. TF02-10 TaxID=2917725 RepID=UPI001FA6F701|nr:helix-turn-helix domain-containing protein [Georgenia sp. TF02-10]UNX55937.1 helix-turn-helix domain-containing protein [Georgenia sp. TF02-10]